jgi:hypothetical protein
MEKLAACVMNPNGTASTVLNNPGHIMRIGGKELALSEIAARYLPILYLHKKLDNMRPDRVLYEALEQDGVLYMNYYVQWRDEIAPFLIYHIVYQQIRKIRYGAITDIEFVELGINLTNGRVDSMAFEWDPNGKPNSPVPLHYMIVATRCMDASAFRVTVRDEPADPFEIKFEADRPTILVPVWNHIYDFYRGEGVRLDDPPLEPMTEQLYAKYWMAKRSRTPSRIRAFPDKNK